MKIGHSTKFPVKGGIVIQIEIFPVKKACAAEGKCVRTIITLNIKLGFFVPSQLKG